MSKDQKNDQLGMNYSTASNRLRKDILWHYVKKCGDNTCYQCGKKIETQDELSIEHKKPWLHSENPIELFFDLDNIAFSHRSCNYAAAAKPTKVYASKREQENARTKRRYHRTCPEIRRKKRREKYLRSGT